MARDYRLRIGPAVAIPVSYLFTLAEQGGLTDAALRSLQYSRSFNEFVSLQDAATPFIPGGTGITTITHGSQLTASMTGPWGLQGVAQGSETLATVSTPTRGYWRLDAPSEFAPTSTYVNDNNPSNHGGIVPTGGMTIDGFSYPAGTVVSQFNSFPGSNFYGNGQGGRFLWRGCRFRRAQDATSGMNDNNSTYTGAWHWTDHGSTGITDALVNEACLKFIGGSNHRVYRAYMDKTVTGIQPNVDGCRLIENYIRIMYFGSPGFYHLNGISCEGGNHDLYIQRNNIALPSPDPNGKTVDQTGCINLFTTNGLAYSGDIRVEDNYTAGGGYVWYPGGSTGSTPAGGGLQWRRNQLSTQYWTNGGFFGEAADQPSWGSLGNVATGNVYADDYGTNGNGQNATSARQYPTGNGPRTGTLVMGSA